MEVCMQTVLGRDRHGVSRCLYRASQQQDAPALSKPFPTVTYTVASIALSRMFLLCMAHLWALDAMGFVHTSLLPNSLPTPVRFGYSLLLLLSTSAATTLSELGAAEEG